jgi:hypothetical protein
MPAILPVQLDLPDYQAGLILHTRHSRKLLRQISAFAIAMAGTGLYILLRKPPEPLLQTFGPLFLYAGLAQCAFHLLFSLVLTPMLAQSQYNRDPVLQRPHAYKWDDDHFTVRSQTQGAEFAWADLYGFREDERSLLIYTTPRQYFCIPRRCFVTPGDAALFTALLRRKLKPRIP